MTWRRATSPRPWHWPTASTRWPGALPSGWSRSGTADPYALRRACIAVLRTLLEKGFSDPRYATLDLLELLDGARAGYTIALDKDPPMTLAALSVFATERLRGLLTTATSGVVADAVVIDGAPLASNALVRHPVYALARARALHAIVKEAQPWLGQARTVAKRLSGISKEAAPVLHPASDFQKADDAAIVKVVEDLDHLTRDLRDEPSVRRALAATEELAQRVDSIFINTLVNDPADANTPARLELLSYGAQCMQRLADFSRLGG